jgi:hypothetical protein
MSQKETARAKKNAGYEPLCLGGEKFIRKSRLSSSSIFKD